MVVFHATFPTLNCCFPHRLNKIGKNPNLVAHREDDLGSESKTINAVVNALAEQAAHGSASEESVKSHITNNVTHITSFTLAYSD